MYNPPENVFQKRDLFKIERRRRNVKGGKIFLDFGVPMP